MEGLFWLSEEQLERIKPFFPNSGGVSRVDEPKVLSGVIDVQRHGLRSRGCQPPMEPTKPSTTTSAPARRRESSC